MAMSSEAIDRFHERVVGRRLTDQTASEYETWIERFEAWREIEGDVQPDLSTLIDFDNHLADPDWIDYPWSNDRGRQPPDVYAYSTRVKAISACKLWLRLHYSTDILDEVQNIVSGSREDFDPTIIPAGDISQTVQMADGCNAPSCRAALQLSYDGILRASELVLITRNDFDLQNGTVKVTATKGSLNATLGLRRDTLTAVRRLLDSVNREKPWLNTYGNPWNARSWAKHVRTVHHPAGSHAWGRHSPIVHRLESGESFGDVYRRARHQNPAMTARYARLVGVSVPEWTGDSTRSADDVV